MREVKTMKHALYPEEPTTIDCSTCLTEIPSDAGQSAEGEDYVLHYCGIECYSQWKNQPKDTEKNRS